MKMGDGGFRPAFNGQFATDVETQIIVGVGITNVGTDKAQAGAMVDQIEQNLGRLPGKLLVDNGFVRLDIIEDLEGRGVRVVAPVQKPLPFEGALEGGVTCAKLPSDQVDPTGGLRPAG